MGLLKAGVGAMGGVLADQWRDYFYCDALDADTLAVKAQKRTGGRSSNKKGEDNIISNGSVIAVADGQCMIIVEQGKIAEVCAEPGEFVYDSSTEPSVFYGNLGENIKQSFSVMGKRFGFGGDAAKDQRVYYMNTKEITGNKFGTANPVPFKVVINEALGFKLSVDLRCHGTYSYRLTDPLSFYVNVCANVSEDYTRDRIDEMLKAELIQHFQPALAKLSAAGISYDQIPAKTGFLVEALNSELVNDWGRRGISVVSMNIDVPSIPDEQRKKITEWEETAMTTNPNIAASRMVGAQSDAMRTAAANEGGMGAMGGFFGMNMAQQAGGMNAQNLYAMGAQQPAQPQPTAPPQGGWTCSCGAAATGKFCPECGKPKPVADGWTCSCGAVNKGKFCAECGKPKPAGAPLYKCDKCGWEPEDSANPPKFCPECGDVFDDNDIQ